MTELVPPGDPVLATPPADSALTRPRLNVLIVDDDPAFLEEMVEHIDRRGVAVQGCDHPAEAFALMAVERPALMFIDVLLPGMGGLRLAERAMGLDYRMTIVLMTGSDADYYDPAIRRLPVADIIKKPFSWHLADPYLEAFIGAV